MSFQKMPPQAYTKETLQEAFEWWNQQPEEFRDKVQDKDDLVGYYLKVRRRYPESEVSDVAKASFSSELKGLAKNLDDFEGYQSRALKNEKAQAPSFEQPAPQMTTAKSIFKTPPVMPEVAKHAPSEQLKFPDMTKSPVVAETFELDPSVKKSLTLQPSKDELKQRSLVGDSKYFKLDPKSAEHVSQVRRALNLSSDQEALRAIIAMGASRLSSIIG